MVSVPVGGGDYRGWVNGKPGAMEKMERQAWRVEKMWMMSGMLV